MTSIYYTEPAPTELPRKFLVCTLAGEESRFPFYELVEVGRYHLRRPLIPGQLLIDDATVSRRHCFVTQTPDGRCWIRDVSRNGTRLDGRRLVPNIEHEMRIGQAFELGQKHGFLLDGDDATADLGFLEDSTETVGAPRRTAATILVGDIRDYTRLVRLAPQRRLQASVGRVFELLTRDVIALGGTVKEYQGDALLAFWEKASDPRQVAAACRAALHLERRVREIAADRAVWDVDDFSLDMDWALSTGLVVLDAFGGTQPTGLSLIGEPVVRAFRLEKLANDRTGRILACAATQMATAASFRFRDLGEMQAKGFDRPDRVFALVSEVDGP